MSIGEVRDVVKDINGNIIEVRDWSRNSITDGLGILVASIFKQHDGITPNLYWAIGSGDDDWDTENPPKPSRADSSLVHEIGRKAIDFHNIKFVDNNGRESEAPTNRILISQTFLTDECNGKWMEMAIFGGNATDELGSGIMINHKTHGLVTKDTNKVIERQIRFTFRQEVE